MQIIQPNFKYKVAMECLYILLSILYHKYNIRTIVNEKLVPLLRNIYSELAGALQATSTLPPRTMLIEIPHSFKELYSKAFTVFNIHNTK